MSLSFEELLVKIRLHPIRPRNPLVVATLFRSAGRHRRAKSLSRQRGRRLMQSELRQLKDIP